MQKKASPAGRMIIDTREPSEFAFSHVAGAVNIPPAQIMAGAKQLAGVPKDAELILYCNTGSRSRVCAHILSGLGFNNVVNGINMHHVQARYLK